MDTLITQLNRHFNALRTAGVVKTQKDFATLIGYSESTMSSALAGNPRALTEKMVARAEFAVREYLHPDPAPAAPDIIIPAATAKMYADMAESIRILSELVAAQQKGASVDTPANVG